MSSPDGDILATDKAYLNAMERANDQFLSALRGEQINARGRKWSGASTSTWTPQASPRRAWAEYRATEHIAERERVDALRVRRDPCPYCATRGDIGCKHRRLA